MATGMSVFLPRMARIPPKTVSTSDKTKLQVLDVELKRVIFGQDQAVDQLVTAIKLSRAGLREPETDQVAGDHPIDARTGERAHDRRQREVDDGAAVDLPELATDLDTPGDVTAWRARPG